MIHVCLTKLLNTQWLIFYQDYQKERSTDQKHPTHCCTDNSLNKNTQLIGVDGARETVSTIFFSLFSVTCMHHISASECVGWVMLQSLHTPWAPCRIFHDVSTGTTFTDGFTELGQDCVKVKLKQSQFHSCAPRLKSPRARLWQNTLLSETRHTRSIISYCEKQISISVSPTEKIISSRESLQPLRTGSCWWVPLWSREARWNLKLWVSEKVWDHFPGAKEISVRWTQQIQLFTALTALCAHNFRF